MLHRFLINPLFMSMLVLVFMPSLLSGAENTNLNTSFKFPQQMRYTTGEVTESSSVESSMDAKFYPIGWSKLGHFAYIRSKVEDAKASNDVDLLIIDLTKDSLVDAISYECEQESNNCMDLFWASYAQSISNLLHKWKIVDTDDSLKPFPIQAFQHTYTIDVQETCTSDSIYGLAFSKDIVISLHKSDNTSKRISFQKDGLCKNTKVVGYVKSPFEDRIFSIVTTSSPGFEGGPSERDFRLVGSHLLQGFSLSK